MWPLVPGINLTHGRLSSHTNSRLRHVRSPRSAHPIWKTRILWVKNSTGYYLILSNESVGLLLFELRHIAFHFNTDPHIKTFSVCRWKGLMRTSKKKIGRSSIFSSLLINPDSLTRRVVLFSLKISTIPSYLCWANTPSFQIFANPCIHFDENWTLHFWEKTISFAPLWWLFPYNTAFCQHLCFLGRFIESF